MGHFENFSRMGFCHKFQKCMLWSFIFDSLICGISVENVGFITNLYLGLLFYERKNIPKLGNSVLGIWDLSEKGQQRDYVWQVLIGLSSYMHKHTNFCYGKVGSFITCHSVSEIDYPLLIPRFGFGVLVIYPIVFFLARFF